MSVKKIENLNKHENPATNTNPFDVDTFLNENWDKVKEVVDNNADELIVVEQDISDIKQEQTTQNENITKNASDIKDIQDKNAEQDEEIANINKKDTAQDTNIETLQQRLNEKDNQIVELEDKVSDLNNNQIHGKASGEYVHLSDSAKMNCEIGICGNSKQETREGYNLYDNSKLAEVFQYNSSITIENEVIAVTNDSNSTTKMAWGAFGAYFKDVIKKITVGETYRFSLKTTGTYGETAGTDTVRAFVIFRDANNKDISTRTLNSTFSQSFTVPENCAYIGWRLDVNGKATHKFYDFMITKGTDNKPYEPYGAMPSFDYPSEIECVSSANVKVCNKNLFDKDKITVANRFLTTDGNVIDYDNTVWSISEYIKLKPNTSYVLNGLTGGSPTACLYDKDKKYISNIGSYNNRSTITFTTKEDECYIRISFISNSELTDYNADKLQLEEDTATDYIAHEEQNYPVDVQEPMLEGDYFDLENGKEVHNWQKIESYNGEEITTEYKSTTGELSTGATVYYKLAEPRKLDLTDNQKAQLQALAKAKTYKNITNITTDTIAVLDVDYKRDLETYQKQQDDRITAIEQLLSTTATSAMLLDNVQSDLESEVQ